MARDLRRGGVPDGVHPSNRRISKPHAPRDVLDDGQLSLPDPNAPKEAPKKESAFVAAARTVFGVALVIGVSWSVAWAARHYVSTSPRFAVTDVSVAGAHLRSPETILGEGKIIKGANVFAVDLDEARVLIGKDPWIRDVTLGRRLPGTILVQVTEREASALVALGETYLASRDGEIFKRLESGDPTDLPIITGINADAVADDREGVARSIRRALDLASDYERGPLAQRAALQEIHLGNDGSTTLVVGKSAMSLVLGEPPFRRKLEEAARVLTELDHRGAKADAIMLDNEGRPERVVVRMR